MLLIDLSVVILYFKKLSDEGYLRLWEHLTSTAIWKKIFKDMKIYLLFDGSNES